MLLRKATTLVAMLAMLLIASAPLVLAQQQEEAAQPPDEVAGATADTPVSPTIISSNGSGALQYEAVPDPVVPPGYQKVGDSYCPTFDPHGPPCFLIP